MKTFLERLRALLRRVDRYRPYRLVRVLGAKPLGPQGKRFIGVLVAGILSITVWQEGFGSGGGTLDPSFKITAASGVHYDRYFTYFLYYLNLFPVVSTANTSCANDTQAGCWDSAGTPADYSYEAAKNVLMRNGKTLQQDLGWTWYAGDRGKIYLYLFDAWLKGAPWNPSPRPASRLGFMFALWALFASMWWVRRPVLGGLLVVFLGSNPFQLFEVHGRDNVFGWNITTAILLLAIHVPLLQKWYRPDKRLVFLWPIGVGLLMATLRTVRSEPMPMLLGAVATYALLGGFTIKRRAAMIAVLAGTFWLTGTAWNAHFLHKQNQAAKIIAQHGGHPYPSDIRLYHHVWHPIWCGLGDFGQKYGYEWNDHAAAAWAKPYLEARGVYVPSGFFEGTDPREFLDPDTKIYKKLPYDIPYYNDLIRDKILTDIKKDPVWYLGVLAKRIHRIFTMTTPVRISWWTSWWNMPWHAVLAVPLVLLLAAFRSRFLLGITLFTLPSLTTALVVYSDRGITYYGLFHIVAFATLASIAVSHAYYWGARALRNYRTRSVVAEPVDG
jgi:hypothetical protein